MVRPSARASAALAIVASTLAALGVVAAGVQLGESDLGDDPRRPSAMLSRPAAQVVVPVAPSGEQALAAQLLVTSAATAAQPSAIPVPAPGPQSVPAPGPSDQAAPPPPADPTPPPSAPPPVPEIEPPVQPPAPIDAIVDPLVTLLQGLLAPQSPQDATADGVDAQEAGAEAPTSLLSGLLGL